MKIRSILIGLIFSVLAATSLASSGLAGRPAPDFALKSSSGENLRLSEYRGDVVMINFWATWCGPCRQEMPLLDELYSRYQRVGFNLLGVNIDDDSNRAMAMINELGVSFPVLPISLLVIPSRFTTRLRRETRSVFSSSGELLSSAVEKEILRLLLFVKCQAILVWKGFFLQLHLLLRRSTLTSTAA